MKFKNIKVKNIEYTKDKVIVTDNNDISYTVVLYSPGYGAGLGWNKSEMPNIHTNPELAKLVLSYSDESKIIQWFEDKGLYYPGEIDYVFIPCGNYYYITDYDGAESVMMPKKAYFLQKNTCNLKSNMYNSNCGCGSKPK